MFNADCSAFSPTVQCVPRDFGETPAKRPVTAATEAPALHMMDHVTANQAGLDPHANTV